MNKRRHRACLLTADLLDPTGADTNAVLVRGRRAGPRAAPWPGHGAGVSRRPGGWRRRDGRTGLRRRLVGLEPPPPPLETARSEPDVDSRVTSMTSPESGLSVPGSFAEQSALLRRPLSRRERAASMGCAATAG